MPHPGRCGWLLLPLWLGAHRSAGWDFAWVQHCKGRALDRVTKQKHRPIGKNCPKNVRKLCLQPVWTIFGHFRTFFRHFSDILSTFPCLGCPMICPLQVQQLSNRSIPLQLQIVAVAIWRFGASKDEIRVHKERLHLVDIRSCQRKGPILHVVHGVLRTRPKFKQNKYRFVVLATFCALHLVLATPSPSLLAPGTSFRKMSRVCDGRTMLRHTVHLK